MCSCATKPTVAPVVAEAFRSPVQKGVHVVQSGESLALIANRYQRNYLELAKINGIMPPFFIKPGDKIALSRSEAKQIMATQTRAPKVAAKPEPKPKAIVAKAQPKPDLKKESVVKKPEATVTTSKKVDKSEWQWPTQGEVIGQYQKGSSTHKGIEITNKKGTPILASKPGKVVYSGEALRGYGRLLIIKHDEQYLSAYAHNDKLLVKEGQHVTQGQHIATMGQTDAEEVKLHFEIRYKGKPVDPLRYLNDQG